MITEILTRPAEIQIENNSYKIEYDNKRINRRVKTDKERTR